MPSLETASRADDDAQSTLSVMFSIRFACRF
jgi:hypothetical protein